MMDNDINCDLEDDVTMSSMESLDFRYQKEIVYNKFFPYANELGEEARTMLAEIKSNLGRAVMLREMDPGCNVWTIKLYKYIKMYGLKFSKEDHITFIKIYYELVIIPDLEPYLVSTFAYILILLLKKKELISPDEMELPWRPLYDLKRRIIVTGHTTLGLYRYFPSIESSLTSLIQKAKIYFPSSATQEILDELRPMICPLDDRTMTITLKTLECFLPLELRPEHHSLSYHLWFNEFMTLWGTCHNIQCENEMVWLMARLASNNIGYIDWKPHLPLIFTRFVQCLNLPVSYKQSQNNGHHKINVSPVSLWIVSVLGNGSSAQMYFEKFLKSIETYFHSANFGRWFGKLKELLRKLSYHFILRLYKERYGKRTWETPVPDSHKLTDEDIDAFVKSMMPIAMTAMFNKLGVSDACSALQYLANMRPSLVVPDVLERMYSTLTSLTEPHKLTATMICMVAVARPMVQGCRNINTGYTYDEGPSHVLPLLFSSLPGIDPNDVRKCFLTFRLISIYTTLVPIVDSSRSHTEMDEEERIVCETTSRFEDFVLQFFDRIFSLIDSSSLEFVRMENRAGDGKSKRESMVESALGGVCTSLLIQTSSAIFNCALYKLRSFIIERVFETKVAGQLAAILCQVFARVNGQTTLRALVPLLSEMILDCIDEGDDIVKDENLDNQLLYAMLLLSAVVITPGNFLLPYIDTLTQVLNKVLQLKSQEGNQIACQLLKHLFYSLSTIIPCEFRSTKRDYNDPEYLYIRDWGQPIDTRSMNIKWYVPEEEQILIIQQLFSRYLPPELTKIENYYADKSSTTRRISGKLLLEWHHKWMNDCREELLISLNVVSSIIGGCESILPVWEEPPLTILESSLSWSSFLPTVGIKGALRMPDGSNVRSSLARVMSTLQDTMLKNSEDDTKSLFVLVQIWNSLLFGKLRLDDTHEARCKKFQSVKKTLEDLLVRKKGNLGPFILKRISIQQEIRLRCQSYCATETHKFIILELFELAISRYADVRVKAQCVLLSALKYFSSYIFVVPQIINILAKDPEEHHEAIKGVLYILLALEQNFLMSKRDWLFLRNVWPAIVHSRPSEKLSVIRLKENLTYRIRKHFLTTTITLEMPDSCLKAASALWDNSVKPSLLRPNENEIQEGLQHLKKFGERNLELYNSLLDELMNAILEGTLHWRHRLMAMTFIKVLVHPEHIYPIKVVRYFLEALIHDSLEERKIAMKVIIYILKQQKRKHPKVLVDVSKLQKQFSFNREPKDKCNSEEKLDNAWLQYNYELRPLTAEQWDEPRFVHQPYIGYYAWPKKLEVYAPSSEQPCLDPTKRVLSLPENEVHVFFNNPQNVDKLVRFLSLEEKKDKDKFSGCHFLFFKNFFRNHGDVHLKHFLPHLQKLVAEKQESSQRCAAEIVAGLIRGAKHWPYQMTTDMWDALLPIIRIALSNLTVETVADWSVCFTTAQERRDPNRYYWLLECLMEEPPLKESEASFIECGRLCALQGALDQQIWRVAELLHRLLSRLEDRLLNNPFKNVRDRLGSLLATIFDADFKFFETSSNLLTPHVQDLLDKVIPQLQQLAQDPPVVTVSKEKSLNSLVSDVTLNDIAKSTNNMKIDERDANVRLFKTVCTWFVCCILHSPHGTVTGFYELFPIICQLESCETDEELSKICSRTLAVLAQALTLPNQMTTFLSMVTQVSNSSSWWARATCLEFLQVSVFHNMSIILSNPEWVNYIREIVLRLLEDERLEVREKAEQVLGGLLHCMFIPNQEILLEQFKVKAKTRISKRKNCNLNEKEARDRNTETIAIRMRHAGILGLCAFIHAHPYDIPNYLPPIFEELGPHLNDPQPIPVTIRRTLGNFKRTHYDGWNGVTGHAQHFTEEQLAVLDDLIVPPSYCA